MSLWLLVGIGLVGISIIIALVAWIMGFVMGFKVHPGWGIFNLIGGLCLFPLPQIIFSLVKLDDRWPLLVVTLGGIIPSIIGVMLLLIEGTLVAP